MPYPKSCLRGEVYFANIGNNDSNSKVLKDKHPVIIISNNAMNKYSPLVMVIPCTSKIDKLYPTEVLLDELPKPSKAMCDHITLLDKTSLDNNIVATISAAHMVQIEKAILIALAIS